MTDVVYDAFISYRRSDGARTAHWLRRELQAFRSPRQLRDRVPQRLRIYLDSAYERGTTNFFENTIRPALLASRFLIVVATPDAVRRPEGQEDWIAREIDEFAAGPHGGNLLLVRGAGEFGGPLPGDLQRRFPHIQIIDLRDVGRLWFLNPLRASRISGEKLKLIAPIIACPPQDMPVLRREQERIQQVRAGAVAGITLAAFTAISVLTVLALASRARAVRAIESSLAATGSLVRKLGASEEQEPLSTDDRRHLLNDVCDIFDGLRKEADADARALPLVVCLVSRAKDREALRELDQARQSLQAAVAKALAIHARGHVLADGRSVLIALDEREDFFERQHDSAALLASLAAADSVIAGLESAHPDQSDFLEARARRLQRRAELENQLGNTPEQLAALDQAVVQADAASRLQVGERQARALAWKGQLLMRAAEAAHRLDDDPGAVARLETAAATMDAAIQADKPALADVALDFAAIYVMLAELEAGRRNPAAAQQARAKGRQKLEAVDASKIADQAERERLVSVRAALERSPPSVPKQAAGHP
jgi:hypothetical protein